MCWAWGSSDRGSGQCVRHCQEAPVHHRVVGAMESRLGLPAEDKVCVLEWQGGPELLSAGNCMCNGERGLMGELLTICPGAEGGMQEKWDVEHLVDQTNLRLLLRKVGRGGHLSWVLKEA